MARLTFHGATEGVTGSAYLLEARGARVLLECGLVQGSREEEEANREPFPFEIGRLDAVVLSHAHLDHSGRLPKLVRDGYRGPIYMTEATRDLLEVMLKDAAFLEARDTEWANKHRRRRGEPEIEALFTIEDVAATMVLCEGIAYGARTTLAEGIEITFRDAGHILGSAIVEIDLTEAGERRRIVFSGDLGNSSAALLRDPETIRHADVLLLESTYGDRDHRSMDDTLAELEEIIEAASANSGNILIPAFAVGRTQEILFRLGELYHRGKLRNHTVCLDSPMAIAATEIYQRHQDAFNRTDRRALEAGRPGSFESFLPVLRYAHSPEDSMALNRVRSGAIIIAGSGMCTGGRIRHHLRHNLARSNTDVVIVGFQARGTPGRALVDGTRTFRYGQEEIAVKATIHTLGGFSAHAGQSQLLHWVEGVGSGDTRIYLVHGEDEAKAALAHELEVRGRNVTVPRGGTRIDI